MLVEGRAKKKASNLAWAIRPRHILPAMPRSGPAHEPGNRFMEIQCWSLSVLIKQDPHRIRDCQCGKCADRATKRLVGAASEAR